MKIFTYKNYIECIHKLRLNAVLRVAEEGETYNLEVKTQEKNKDKKHDKLVKTILKNPEEMAKIINEFLEPSVEVKGENLVKYTNSYITQKYKSKEADIVYKLKNEEVFFLVEHQSTIDKKMPYRILNYCVDIMQEWVKSKKLKRQTKYPIVVPIIIYTGIEKWKIPKNFKDVQISNQVFGDFKIDLYYNLIEINKLSKKYLIDQQSLFGYGMVIEKSKNKAELQENLELIVKNAKSKEKLMEISNIIEYLFYDMIEESAKEMLIEKINLKLRKEEKDMSSLYERLLAETCEMIKEGKNEGIEEGKKIMREIMKEEATQSLLKNNVDEEIILKSMKITKKELEEIKKNMKIEAK
mgnify:FL=1